jgi:GNAT superfamily N-acetyltransferase
MRTSTYSCARPVAVGDPGELRRTENDELVELARAPWTLRVGKTAMVVRPSSARDLSAVARMHTRCSPRSLLDRYRVGGRPPAVAALDHDLRGPYSVVVTLADGAIIAHASLARDRAHTALCATFGLLVQDSWQRRGLGAELTTHLAGVGYAAGFNELIVYPATAVTAAQRLMVEVGRTRMVPDTDLHLHTYLSDAASLGLGSVRQRLAG